MPQYNQDSRMLRILRSLADSALELNILFESFVMSGPHIPGVGRRKFLTKNEYKKHWEKIHDKQRRLEIVRYEQKERQRLHTLLYKLQRDGLIVRKRQGIKSFFSLTSKGHDKKDFFIKKIAREGKNQITYTIPNYQPKPSTMLSVVIFDIHEKERHKRGWLRCALRHMHFRMLQQSVWIARCVLPEAFIRDLKDMNILHNVIIFSVAKSGNINLPDV